LRFDYAFTSEISNSEPDIVLLPLPACRQGVRGCVIN